MDQAIYTIGHSTQTVEQLCGLLHMHRVTAIADVRSTPYSRRNPQFNREALEAELAPRGITYVYLGEELGARPSAKNLYEHGRVRYEKLAATSEFQRGLDRVSRGSERYRLALMCAEANPLQCHRTILVSRYLKERGLRVEHILRQGRLESQEEAERRLLRMHNLRNGDLFLQDPERLAEAYRLQEEAIAYSSPAGSKHQTALSRA